MKRIKLRKQRARAKWPALCVLAALALTVPVALRAQTVELRSNDSVQGAMVLLRDIARSPYSLPEEWLDREIVRAPQPGEPIRISMLAIASALNRYPDMRDVVLRGEAQIALARTGTPLATEMLHEAIRAYAYEQPQWQETELHIEYESKPVEVALSNGDPEIRVLSMTPEDRPNRYRFVTEVSVPGASARTVSVSARVEPMQQVWVAARSMSRGHVLGEEDLETAWMPPAAARPYLPVEEIVTGMEANREIRSSQPLSAHFLVAPVNARRGDTVHVTAYRGGLQVTLRATALATGRRGERILCMNETSRRRFLVRLTDVREATVDF